MMIKCWEFHDKVFKNIQNSNFGMVKSSVLEMSIIVFRDERVKAIELQQIREWKIHVHNFYNTIYRVSIKNGEVIQTLVYNLYMICIYVPSLYSNLKTFYWLLSNHRNFQSSWRPFLAILACCAYVILKFCCLFTSMMPPVSV